VQEALRQAFRPEFLNRIDDIIVFSALTEDELTQIIDLQVREVVERMLEQGVGLEMSKAAKMLLVREGYNPSYGARPLRRTVQRLIETPLSRDLLKSIYQAGDTVVVDVDERGALVFQKKPAGTLEISSKAPAEPLGAA
jgi:ATP-dependent Clp protease ATP-binding subunit ClpC